MPLTHSEFSINFIAFVFDNTIEHRVAYKAARRPRWADESSANRGTSELSPAKRRQFGCASFFWSRRIVNQTWARRITVTFARGVGVTDPGQARPHKLGSLEDVGACRVSVSGQLACHRVNPLRRARRFGGQEERLDFRSSGKLAPCERVLSSILNETARFVESVPRHHGQFVRSGIRTCHHEGQTGKSVPSSLAVGTKERGASGNAQPLAASDAGESS